MDAKYQNVASTGILVNKAKKIQVKSPPWTCCARNAGTKARMRPRKMLLKLSLLAASAGRGAFLIEGYYQMVVSFEE